MSGFVKATKQASKGRLALLGPAGSGKTYTALTFATAMAKGGKVAVIDTERGSARKYSDLFGFDVLELNHFTVEAYIGAIKDAETAGYSVLAIDSLSHAWAGPGGVLEFVDDTAKRMRSGNSFAAWREATPLHNSLVDAIIGASLHVIVTMRTKTEYVVEDNERGKKAPRKIGMQPVQRDGMEYEFDVVADLDQEHNIVISKSRCHLIADQVARKPGAEFIAPFVAWLSDGEAVVDAPPEAPPEAPTTGPAQPAPMTAPAMASDIVRMLGEMEMDTGDLTDWLTLTYESTFNNMQPDKQTEAHTHIAEMHKAYCALVPEGVKALGQVRETGVNPLNASTREWAAWLEDAAKEATT